MKELENAGLSILLPLTNHVTQGQVTSPLSVSLANAQFGILLLFLLHSDRIFTLCIQ